MKKNAVKLCLDPTRSLLDSTCQEFCVSGALRVKHSDVKIMFGSKPTRLSKSSTVRQVDRDVSRALGTWCQEFYD